MNDQFRDELLAALASLGRKYPDWRFGQLVANIAGWADQEIWDVDDEKLLDAVRLHFRQQLESDLPPTMDAPVGSRS